VISRVIIHCPPIGWVVWWQSLLCSSQSFRKRSSCLCIHSALPFCKTSLGLLSSDLHVFIFHLWCSQRNVIFIHASLLLISPYPKYHQLSFYYSDLKCSWFQILYIVARMRRLYKTGVGLTTGFIRSHTITVYTLHKSLMQLQLFSEGCCSARILTRNWNCPHNREREREITLL
jgi:hypothetical protein